MATVVHEFDLGALVPRVGTAFPQYLDTAGTNFPVPGLAFDAATAESIYSTFKAINYGSGNLTIEIDWYADTASSGDVIWGFQLAAITPDTDTQDVETDGLATANTVTDSHLGTTGQRVHRTSITVSNLDSLANGDRCFFRFYRDAAAGGDTMSGDAIVVGLVLSYSDT